jgi:hypothetical protein
MTEQPATRRPFLNEPVHYVAYGTPGGEFPSVCRAATVTAVGAWVDGDTRIIDEPDPANPRPGAWRQVWQQWHPDAVALCVTNPTGLFLNECVPYHSGRSVEGSVDPISGAFPGGTWHYAGDCAGGRS